jgi:hypothetical protein
MAGACSTVSHFIVYYLVPIHDLSGIASSLGTQIGRSDRPDDLVCASSFSAY